MGEGFYEKLDIETIETNEQGLCRYADMREHLLKDIKNRKGRAKILSEELLDLIDFVAELENGDSHSDLSESDLRGNIYYILS